MKILIAEDEVDMLDLYKVALEEGGHSVVVTTNGQDCVAVYQQAIKGLKSKASPFDAVVLDYRMPKMDGMEAARKILSINPEQRIIFASAFVKETLVESIKELHQVVELMQKPFAASALLDTIEDKEIYDGLKSLMVNVREIKDTNPSHKNIKELFEGLRKIQKGRTF